MNAINMPAITDEFRLKLGSLRSQGRVDLVEDIATGVARIVFNDPAKRNCLSGEMMLQLADAVGSLEQRTHIKAVLLCGANSFFCSGANLVSMKSITTPDEGRQMSALMQDTLTRLANLPMITVALVEGRALGGGAELTTATDFRIMSPDAEVQFVHMRMGITSAWGGMARLTRLVGPTLSLELFASGRPLRSDEALRVGFASHVLCGGPQQQSPMDETLQWTNERTKWPVEIVRALKQGMVASLTQPLDTALRRENELFASVWSRDAHSAALKNNIKH